MFLHLQKVWSRGPELNRRPDDYESSALPAELPRLSVCFQQLNAGTALIRCPFLAHGAFQFLHRSLRFRAVNDDVIGLSCGHVRVAKNLLNNLIRDSEPV